MIEIKILVLLLLLLLEVNYLYIIIYSCCLLYSEYKFPNSNENFEVPKDNIFLNQIPYDDLKQRDIEKIKKYVDENQEKSLKTLYYEDIFRPLTDYFEKKSSYRQFYTTPDVSGHIEYLLGNMQSCKEDATICFPFSDVRHS